MLILWICCMRIHATPSATEHTMSGFAQGTSYQIKYFSEKLIHQREVDSILNVIDVSMSLYRRNSLLNRFNDPNVTSVIMDPHMEAVVKESFKVYELTNGFFDISVFPLVALWGFGPNGFDKVPSQEQIDSVRHYVGMDKLAVDENVLYKLHPRVQIDVNGIAQGYTVDVLADYFLSAGIGDFIIELGGEIRTSGRKPDGDFKIMLDERTDNHLRFNQPVLILRDKAVTTSSIREKNYRVGDRVVSHHIDPVQGKPIANTNRSVTVIAETAMLADALDNYLMYLEPQQAVAFVETLPEVEMCIYYQENNQIKVLYSSGFNNYLYH